MFIIIKHPENRNLKHDKILKGREAHDSMIGISYIYWAVISVLCAPEDCGLGKHPFTLHFV